MKSQKGFRVGSKQGKWYWNSLPGVEASLEIEDGLRIEAKASFESGTSLVIGGVGLGAKAEASLEIGPRAAPELDINSTIERLGLMR